MKKSELVKQLAELPDDYDVIINIGNPWNIHESYIHNVLNVDIILNIEEEGNNAIQLVVDSSVRKVVWE